MIILNVYEPTSDVDAFQGYINAQYAHGGGDEPENSLEALNSACDLKLRPNAKTVFIWITDATYHNPISNLSQQSIISKLNSKDITVFFDRSG